MTEEEIIEGNKLIAKFMGFTYYPHNMEGVTDPGWKTTIDTSCFSKNNTAYNMFLGGITIKNPDDTEVVLTNKKDEPKRIYLCRNHKNLRYHESWDWLVPALYKFDTLFEGKRIINTRKWYHKYEQHCELIDHYTTQYEILPVWEHFIYAIKWYNHKFL